MRNCVDVELALPSWMALPSSNPATHVYDDAPLAGLHDTAIVALLPFVEITLAVGLPGVSGVSGGEGMSGEEVFARLDARIAAAKARA